MTNDLQYYLKLKYPIKINPISEEDGGGFEARIPQLGQYAFVGDGDTIEEALQNLEEIKKDYFTGYLNKGIKIPKPRIEEEEEYSGKFVVRVPKLLHKSLSQAAKKNGASLNQYVITLLSMNFVLHNLNQMPDNICDRVRDLMIQYLMMKQPSAEYKKYSEKIKQQKLDIFPRAA